jgi:hypothetical protein
MTLVLLAGMLGKDWPLSVCDSLARTLALRIVKRVSKWGGEIGRRKGRKPTWITKDQDRAYFAHSACGQQSDSRMHDLSSLRISPNDDLRVRALGVCLLNQVRPT